MDTLALIRGEVRFGAKIIRPDSKVAILEYNFARLGRPKKRMRRKNISGSIVFLVLGLAVAFSVVTRSGWLPVAMVGFGLAAVYSFGFTGRSIRQARASRQGRWLALARALLGLVGAFLCLLIVVGMFIARLNQQRWQTRSNFRPQRAMANSPMPDVPATNFTSNLPIIVLHTDGKYVSNDPPTVVRAEFFDAVNRRASTDNQPVYAGLASMNRRGHSTLGLPKHSYTLRTLDQETNQTKVALLGMPPEEDWVLHAPFEDKTMIRDVLAFELTRKMGRYAPRTRYVELFVQTSDGMLSMKDYRGVYVLMEKIKRGPDRVNIAKLKPEHRSEPEISGGYIVKRDHDDSSGSRFRTGHGGPFFYVSPNARQITSEQKTWLKGYFNSFESALYGADFKDPEKGYPAYLDVDSFIDAHFLIEVGKNVDGFRYSAFLTKDRGGKLTVGPPWDWNRSFGNANYYGGGHVRGWYSSNMRPNEISWHQRLQEDPSYAQRRAARWSKLREKVFDPKKIGLMIDDLAAQLEEAQERNFKRWPILGQNVGCNYFVGDSFQEEVDWLKNWIIDRIDWIDGHVTTSVEF